MCTINITLKNHHTTFECPQRDNSTAQMYKKELIDILANQMSKNPDTYQKLTPHLTLLAHKDLLETADVTPKFARLLYYCLSMKNSHIKLAIAKHILHNNLFAYPDINRLLLKIKQQLHKKNQPELQYQLLVHIIESGAYKNHKDLQKYLEKNPTITLGALTKSNIKKERFYELYHKLIKLGVNINTIWEPNGDTLLNTLTTPHR